MQGLSPGGALRAPQAGTSFVNVKMLKSLKSFTSFKSSLKGLKVLKVLKVLQGLSPRGALRAPQARPRTFKRFRSLKRVLKVLTKL